MNPLDAVWLVMESADTPMHVGVLAIFRKPRNAPPDYVGQLAARMRECRKPVAPWNLRLSASIGGAVTPRLVEVRTFHAGTVCEAHQRSKLERLCR